MINSTNNRKIDFVNICISIFYIIINLLSFFSEYLFNTGNYKEINIISILQLTVNMLMVYSLSKKAIVSLLFLSLSFLVHQSHLILTSNDINTWMLFDTYSKFSYGTAFVATCFVLKSNCFLSLGMIYGIRLSRRYSMENLTKNIRMNYSDDEIANVGGLLCIFGMFFNLYKFICVFSASKNGGYLATFKTGLDGIVLTFSSFFVLCFCVWLKHTKESRIKVSFFCILIVLYEFLYMTTGNRYEPVISIVCILIFYKEKYISKIKPVVLLSLFGVAYLILSVLVAISESRNSTQLINLYQVTDLYSIEQLSSAVAGEFGEAIYNVAQCVEFFPSSFSLFQFLKIFYCIVHIIPGLASRIPNSENVLYYINNFPNHYAMGGSYIGEMYFWAGKTGYILAFPLGILITYSICLDVTNRKHYVFLKVGLYLAFFSIIRGYLFNSIRVIVWLWIISSILLKTNLKHLSLRRSL